MRVIIAGSRSIVEFRFVEEAVAASGFEVTEVVCGGAAGADELGRQWARQNRIPLKMFRANWQRLGKSAGPVRNSEMAAYADALIAIWDGASPGTGHMISEAKHRGLKVFVREVS